MLPLVLVAAIVTQDATPLRAAAKQTAAQQTMLYAGDWVELRGERQGWLQVYDHRHERPGYVRPSQVRAFPVDEKAAVELAAVIDFIRDQPGAESLGIGLVALFMRAAPASAVGAEVFDALAAASRRDGVGAAAAPPARSRWPRATACTSAPSSSPARATARRGSATTARPSGACWRCRRRRRRKARAALGLTDPACVDPALGRQRARDAGGVAGGRARQGRRVTALPAWLGNRVRVRAASVGRR